MSNLDKQLERGYEEYSSSAGEADSLLVAIVNILTSKLGDELGGPLKELGQIIQALTGLQNSGVNLAQNVLTGVERYGVSGMTSEGSSGTIIGRDMISAYAASAINREISAKYMNPVTGLTNSAALGLNQSQIGQAAALALSTGQQYAGGAMVQTNLVTEEYKKKLMAEGTEIFKMSGGKDRALLDEANALQVGGVHAGMTAAGKEGFEKSMQDSIATLSSIKAIMGSKALEDLEGTIDKVFGGDLKKFGMKAARMRMAEVKALSAEFGGGEEGVRMAVAHLQAAGDRINTGDRAEDMQMAAYVERLATAGGRAGLKNAGIAAGRNEFAPSRSRNEIADRVAGEMGIIAQEEEEMLLMDVMTDTRGNAEQKKRAAELHEEMRRATTAEEVNDVRSRMKSLTAEIDPNATIEKLGGSKAARAKRSAETRQRAAETVAGIQSGRNQALLREKFKTDQSYSFGMDAETAGIVGMGAANMDPVLREQLSKMIDNPETTAEDYDKFRKDNADIDRTLGAETDAFFEAVKSGKVSREALTEYASAAELYEGEHGGFVSKAEINKKRDEELQNLLGNKSTSGMAPSDIWKKTMSGIWGDREWTPQEVMSDVLKNDPKGLTTLKLDQGKFAATDENLAAINSLLSDKDRAAMGMPEGDAEAQKQWMRENTLELTKAIDADPTRASLAENGQIVYSTKAQAEEARKRLSLAAINRNVEAFTGDKLERKENESDAAYEKRANEYIKKNLDKDQIGAILKTAGADLGDAAKNPENAAAAEEQLAQLKKAGILDAPEFGIELEKQISQTDKELKKYSDIATKMREDEDYTYRENGKTMSEVEVDKKRRQLEKQREGLNRADEYITRAGESAGKKEVVINTQNVTINGDINKMQQI